MSDNLSERLEDLIETISQFPELRKHLPNMSRLVTGLMTGKLPEIPPEVDKPAREAWDTFMELLRDIVAKLDDQEQKIQSLRRDLDAWRSVEEARNG